MSNKKQNTVLLQSLIREFISSFERDRLFENTTIEDGAGYKFIVSSTGEIKIIDRPNGNKTPKILNVADAAKTAKALIKLGKKDAGLDAAIKKVGANQTEKTAVPSPDGFKILKIVQGLQGKVEPKFIAAAISVKSHQDEIESQLGIDAKTLAFLLVAAIGVSGRESDFGTGKAYKLADPVERLASDIIQKTQQLIGTPESERHAGASVGPTQIRYRLNMGPGSALEKYAKSMHIYGNDDLMDYSKAIIGTIGMLSNLCKEAQKYDYSMASPGINPKHQFTSTGSAALDLALIGYNMSPNKIKNYCKKEDKMIPCEKGTPNIISNYIPAYTSPGKAKLDPVSLLTGKQDTLSSLGYVSEVSENMKKFDIIRTVFISVG